MIIWFYKLRTGTSGRQNYDELHVPCYVNELLARFKPLSTSLSSARSTAAMMINHLNCPTITNHSQQLRNTIDFQ